MVLTQAVVGGDEEGKTPYVLWDTGMIKKALP